MMNNLMKYKDYSAKIEYSADDKMFYGRIIGLRDLISFYGSTVEELEVALKDAVDDYLDYCTELGVMPEKTYKGSFNVRIPEELHKDIALWAETRGTSINQIVIESLEKHYKENFDAGNAKRLTPALHNYAYKTSSTSSGHVFEQPLPEND